jgi:Holliday junction resolvasome RuvABC endonuclease subunit
MKILALDLATSTGWALSKEIYGTWDLSIKRDESGGMRLLRLKSKLAEIVALEKIDVIVTERVAGQYKGPLIVGGELSGVVKLFVEETPGLEMKSYSAKEIKQFATGKGNSNKAAMIKAANLKYGYPGSSDDEADALHMLHLAQREFQYLLDLGQAN